MSQYFDAWVKEHDIKTDTLEKVRFVSVLVDRCLMVGMNGEEIAVILAHQNAKLIVELGEAQLKLRAAAGWSPLTY